MKNKFDLIIFDWDGTLIDTIPWIVSCLQNAAIVCGCAVPGVQAAQNVIGLSINKAVSALFPEADEQMQQRLIVSYSEAYLSKQLSKDDLFFGVYDMLVQLRQDGFQLAVATGKTRLGLQKALQDTGTGDLFFATRCADETASKPDPKMVKEIIAHAGVSEERVLMVGDSIHDLQMAVNAKIAAIGVSCGAHSKEILQQYNPMLCLQHPAELLNII